MITAPMSTFTNLDPTAMAASLGVTAMICLIAFLVAQELGGTVPEGSKLHVLGRYLTVGVVPLLFVFVLLLGIRVLEAI